MKKTKSLFLTYLFYMITLSSCDQKVKWNYPQIAGQKQSQFNFGREVIDNYSNLNNLENPEILAWLKSQDSLAESYFSSNSLMDEYLERFTDLQDIHKGNISLIQVNEAGNYFYLKHDTSSATDKLYYRINHSSEEVELFDSSIYEEETIDITYLSPSYDGKKIAIGFRLGSDFSSQILILDVDRKKVLKDRITNINPAFGGVEWLPDNSGFIYLYFPVVDPGEPGYKKNSFSVIHRLGEDPEKRQFIFGNDKPVQIPPDFYPKVKIGSSQDKYLVGYSASSNDFYDAYIAEISDVISGNPTWLPFFKEEHKVYYNQGEIRNDEFIFRQGNNYGNNLCKVSILSPDFDNPEILAEGSSENAITQFEVTRDAVYYARSKFGVEVSLWKITEDGTHPIQTPFSPGYVSFFGESVTHNSIGLELDGWVSDYTRYLIDSDGTLLREGIQEENNYPTFKNLVSKQIMVTSHDGVQVPMSLVYDKEIPINEKREVFMYVYGAYGESLSPFFFPFFLDWAAQGGILAFPHVRGGGEKGKQWHIQGMKNQKHNSWKDLIACTEELINRGMTRKGLISVYTASAGGITAGMAVNERPDLFSSFIAEVPRLNPFGLESSSTASSTSYLEYGTVKDSLEFMGLLNMDPYLNLKSQTDYPATLIMPSYSDDRIPLWDSGKYIAKLQKNNLAGTPILLDIDYNSGHGESSDYDETVKLYSKIFAFAKSNMSTAKTKGE